MAENLLNQTSIKNLEVGKFYLIHDGSYPGHPGFLVWKDDDTNLYLVIKFGTTPNKNNTVLKHPIGSVVSQSYVYKRFFLGKRKDFGSVVLDKLSINNEDIPTLLQILDFDNPLCSKNISGRNLHKYKFLIKKCHRSTL